MQLAADFLIGILIELAPLAILVLIGAVIWGVSRYKSVPSKSHIRSCDYIVWEAQPVVMAKIEADMADSGWRLVDTSATEADALQCRFEKTGTGSRCLSEIFDFDRFMPRTQQSGISSLVRIKEHGSRDNGDVHKYN